jgi:hypothetical protein
MLEGRPVIRYAWDEPYQFQSKLLQSGPLIGGVRHADISQARCISDGMRCNKLASELSADRQLVARPSIAIFNASNRDPLHLVELDLIGEIGRHVENHERQNHLLAVCAPSPIFRPWANVRSPSTAMYCKPMAAQGPPRSPGVALHACLKWMHGRSIVKDHPLRDHVAAVSCGISNGEASSTG